MKNNTINLVKESAAGNTAFINNNPKFRSSFSVVGIGASAGGLEAFTDLLKALPLDTGMAFVLVQHLDPLHESALTQLLSRVTKMPVHEVTQDLSVEPNNVYVIPPNTSLSISKGVLKLVPREQSRAPHRSVDSFFESLAQDLNERAIGVVLSGTATDGTLGLETIKAEGGITFAQDGSAKYNSMPSSAIAAGCVDFVLSPEDIAKELTSIAKHPYFNRQLNELSLSKEEYQASATKQVHVEAESGVGDSADNGYKKILALLLKHSGVDFLLYKSTTIQRRISRRMVLNRQKTTNDYAQFLKGNTKELDALYSDVLISVTSFFRNTEAFDFLKSNVFPKIITKQSDVSFRFWTLGCSTGQEAYSLAMSFIEYSDNIPDSPKLQIFATDLNNAVLDKARAGLYPKSIADDLSPERLRRFFTEEDGGYRVIKQLREMIVFARQNLLSDPPFSRMDLISCRNLLIYIEPSLQKKFMPTFHYALKPNGCLFLGASESIGTFTDLFEQLDKKHKIYYRKPGSLSSLQMRLAPSHRADREENVMHKPPVPKGFHSEVNAQREADRVTRSRYAPPSVLINAEFQVLEFRGETSPFLKPPIGQASFNLLKMTHDDLMLPLRAALDSAKNNNNNVRQENIRINQDGKSRTLNIEVVPLKNVKDLSYLVFFEDASQTSQLMRPTQPNEPRNVLTPKEESGRIHELETELAETRDYLQSILEEQEAANEELQASNEEVTSANEELQSINEELETSKEELESTNEELTTVNDEMANRNTELNRLNSDMVNLQNSTKLTIVLLGRDLTIRRFSAKAEKQFGLLSTDLGRPLSHIRHNLFFEEAESRKDTKSKQPADIESFIAEVIDTVRESERNVQDKDGKWYSLRVRPYITLDNKVDGAVLVLVDIDALMLTEQAIIEARDYAEKILNTVRDPLLVLDTKLRILAANDAFYTLFKVTLQEVEGCLIYDLGNQEWNIPELRQLLEEILPKNNVFNNYEVTHTFQRIGLRSMKLNARTLKATENQFAKILLGIEDITELMNFQIKLNRSERRYRRLFEAARDGVLLIDPMTRKIIDANPFMSELLGYTKDELIGKELFEIGLHKDEEASRSSFQKLKENGFIRYENLPLESETGKRREVEMVSNLYAENGHEVIQCNVRDISLRKNEEIKLKESEDRFRAIADNIPQLAWMANTNGYIGWFNKGWLDYTGTTIEKNQGWGWKAVHHPDYIEAVVEKYKRHILEGKDWEDTFPLRSKEGEYRWFLSRMNAIRDNNGAVVRFFGTNTDVTEQRKIEEQLQKEKQKADVANKTKTEFLANMSHEIRTPINAVLGLSHILSLSKDLPKEKQLHIINTLQHSAQSLLGLINDLLDISKIETNNIVLEHIPFTFNEIISEVINMLSMKASEKNIALNYVNSSLSDKKFLGDPLRIRQVLLNLIGNGIKFSEQGEITINVKASSLDEPERANIDVVVSDTGIGIASNQLDSIFKKFTQADSSISRKYGGTGLGLSISSNLAELMGGSITIKSELGKGSEFTLHLPLEFATNSTANFFDTPNEQLKADDFPVLEGCVLLAEDYEPNIMVATFMLESLGFSYDVVNNGHQVLEKVRANRGKYKFVLMDVQMPDMDGFEATKIIRQEEKVMGLPHLHIIAMTAHAMEGDRQLCLMAGMDDYISKPFKPQDLINKLIAVSKSS